MTNVSSHLDKFKRAINLLMSDIDYEYIGYESIINELELDINKKELVDWVDSGDVMV